MCTEFENYVKKGELDNQNEWMTSYKNYFEFSEANLCYWKVNRSQSMTPMWFFERTTTVIKILMLLGDKYILRSNFKMKPSLLNVC